MLLENIKMAIESIRSNKMRSFLTMLGIIIGISSVIMIITLGQSAQSYLMSQFEEIGATVVMINVDTENAAISDYITRDDVEALKEKVPNLKAATLSYDRYGKLTFKRKSETAIIGAVSADFTEVQSVELVKGRFFSEADDEAARNVVVIEERAANDYFGTTDVIGIEMDVEIYGKVMTLRVVGVMKSSMGEFVSHMMPHVLYMPINSYIQATGERDVFSSVMLAADDKAHTQRMGNAAISVLEARHSSRGREMYQAQNFMSDLDMMNSVLGLIQSFVAAVAAISLLVGGIGVMNIMLVSVTERTREIGIRKALGAKIGEIKQQFLTESAIITLFGGIIGIMVGVGGAFAVGLAIDMPVKVGIPTILIALVFSSVVGLFFGIYPAGKAAKMNPIEALAHQ